MAEEAIKWIDIITKQDTDRETLITTLNTFADRSKDDAAVRDSLGNPRVLHYLTDELKAMSTSDHELERAMLRCLGNACALRPDAVRIVCDIGLGWMNRYRQDASSELTPLVIGVLYNTLGAESGGEDEPVQENPAMGMCFEAGLLPWLITLLGRPSDTLSQSTIVDTIFAIASYTTLHKDAVVTGEVVDSLLQGLPTCLDVQEDDDVASLIESTASVLRTPDGRRMAAESEHTEGLFLMQQIVHDRIEQHKISTTNPEDLQELVALLRPQASSLTWLMSDISAEPTFAKQLGLDDALVKRCIQQLESDEADSLDISSCLTLGNALLNLPTSSADTIAAGGVLNKLTAKVVNLSASQDLMFAAAGLLTSMCRSRQTRLKIGEDERVISFVEKLCGSEVQEVRNAGARLVRALGRESPHTQRRLGPAVSALSRMQTTTADG